MLAVPANRRVAAAAALSAALLLVLTMRHGTPAAVLHQGRGMDQYHDSDDGDEPWPNTAASAAENGFTAGDGQTQQGQWQSAQPAVGRTATAQGQVARLPVQLRPRPAADNWWHAMHAEFVTAVKAADEGEGFKLIFYGDSLTEMWRGTRGNKPYAPRIQLPGIFHDHFQQVWGAAAFGMSGDTVPALHWRLLHGELPRKQQPRMVVVLIGTNDLKDAKVARDAAPSIRVTPEQAIARAAPKVSQGIGLVLGLIRRRLPQSRILLLALLPRHEADGHRPREWPNMYTKGLVIVNRGLQRYATQHPESVTFLDCGAPFFNGPNRLSDELLPDALHPSSKGAGILADCIGKELARLSAKPRLEG